MLFFEPVEFHFQLSDLPVEFRLQNFRILLLLLPLHQEFRGNYHGLEHRRYLRQGAKVLQRRIVYFLQVDLGDR
jgi:hypothetical protein